LKDRIKDRLLRQARREGFHATLIDQGQFLQTNGTIQNHFLILAVIAYNTTCLPEVCTQHVCDTRGDILLAHSLKGLGVPLQGDAHSWTRWVILLRCALIRVLRKSARVCSGEVHIPQKFRTCEDI